MGIIQRFLWIALFVLVTAGTAGCVADNSVPRVQDGVLDLRSYSLGDQGPVALNGEWEFYWGSLYGPEAFRGQEGPKSSGTTSFPGLWNQITLDGKKLPGHGYATYRLKVKLGANQHLRQLGLMVPSVYTAYRLWVDGQETAVNGRVGVSRETMMAQAYDQAVIVVPQGEEMEILLQISNFHQPKGGPWKVMTLGTGEQAIAKHERLVAFNMLFVGVLTGIGVFYLVLYVYRRRELAFLYFGLFCLLIALRSLFMSDGYAVKIMPWFPWEIAEKIRFIGFYLAVPLFVYYFRELFPLEIKGRMPRLSLGVSVLFSLIVVAFPARVFSHLLIVFQGFSLILVLYLVYKLIQAAKRRRDGVYFTLFSGFFAFLAVIHDILLFNQVVQGPELVPLGMNLFLFGQAFMLGIHFSRAYRRLEDLSRKQARWQEVLEETVEARTRELQQSLHTLQQTQKQLVESEKMASLGNLVAGVAHEINTPLGSGVTAVSHLQDRTKEFLEIYRNNKMKRSDLEGFLQSVEEAVGIVQPNLQRAANLVKSFKRVAVDQFTEEKRVFNLNDYLEEVLTSLKPQLRKTKLEVKLERDGALVIESYPGVISQILTNLIMNSILHAYEPGETGVLTLKAYRDGTDTVIEYADDGCGMPEEVREKIYDPFFTTKRSSGGTGLGMHIVYNLVTQSLGGTIECRSEVGKGTAYTVRIPM